MKVENNRQRFMEQPTTDAEWAVTNACMVCFISGVLLVTRATPSCLMENVFPSVSMRSTIAHATYLKFSFRGMKITEAAPASFLPAVLSSQAAIRPQGRLNSV